MDYLCQNETLNITAESLWKKVLEVIKPKFITPGKYEKYIEPLKPISLDTNALYLEMPEGYSACAFLCDYKEPVESMMKEILGNEFFIRLEYSVKRDIW